MTHGLIRIGQVVACHCSQWSFILPEDQTWTAMLKSYAAHRPELKDTIYRLYYWQEDAYATNFTSLLFMLMQKADSGNFRRLSIGFPLEAEALMLWSASPSSNDFFEAWGIVYSSAGTVVDDDVRR